MKLLRRYKIFGYITSPNIFQYPSQEVGSIFEITIFPIILVIQEKLEITSMCSLV